MKKIILLFVSLFIITACSNKNFPISSSYRMVEDNTNFVAAGLADSDVVTKYKDAQFHRSHSRTMFDADDMEGFLPYYILKSYEEMQEFNQTLINNGKKGKGEDYQVKHLYSEYFATLKESDFTNHYLIVTHDITLTSGSNSYKFKELYLKDNVLYAYSMLSDVNDNPGAVGTTDMVWTGLSFMIEKDVEYTSFKMISDHYRVEYY